MKKTMSKKIVAIMVCTAALAGIYGGPVYAESLYKGNLSDIVYVKGGSTGFPRITDLDLDKVTIDGTNGSITINGQKIQTDNMNNIYVNTGLHTTGQITVDDHLSVSRNATVKGTLAVGTDGGQFIVGENGDISAAGGNFFVAADGATDIAANLNVKDDIVSEGGDVKIKYKNTNEIKLSDLVYLGDLDQELTAHSEYNGTAVGAFNAEAAIRRGEIARLDNRIDELDTRVNKVGAMAAAIASLKSIGYSPEAPTEFSVGVGQYKGKTGIALGFFHYPNKDFMLNFSMSSSSGEMMGGIGATWRFGKAKG